MHPGPCLVFLDPAKKGLRYPNLKSKTSLLFKLKLTVTSSHHSLVSLICCQLSLLMLICSSSTLLIISARHQRCSLSSHHTAPITDHQSLLFINTAAKQPLVNTSSAGQLLNNTCSHNLLITAAEQPLISTSSSFSLSHHSNHCQAHLISVISFQDKLSKSQSSHYH